MSPLRTLANSTGIFRLPCGLELWMPANFEVDPLLAMGGPNLEIFKFSIYLFVPIAALIHFGDPEWYKSTVIPYRDKLFPSLGRPDQHIPKEQSAIREELARFKAERLARRAQKEIEGVNKSGQ
ncbi:hypothetical protein HYPSUDRAFT_930243 [Hypholoma sublateritium FD-334 SS-4]|uniref:Uncharacterized protein n=1 Tax=Hypholoma sublateritium (strain FD-334 SS-4) TaxID=945553 RepID=A0A0D2P8R3_HYPSF|nr:hypothetical protein HYPSUDRAFT_930243 [Hypholoma sublateritium FD-334 SS-4]